jgi:biotin transport system permease protein
MSAASASPVHRLSAASKLAALAVFGLALVLAGDPVVLAAGLAAALAVARVARLPMIPPPRGTRTVAAVLLVVVLANAVTVSWVAALATGLRLSALIVAAATVTATTRASAMLETLSALLRPLRKVGVDPEAVALALSLTLRFVPQLVELASEIRAAQWARGLDRHPLALMMPLLVRALASADAVADAIDARTFSTPEPPNTEPERR